MKELLWKIAAYILSRPMIANYIIRRSHRTPYTHIPARHGAEIYMYRDWLFNPYGKNEDGSVADAKWKWLPSIRVHQIMLPDDDKHMHDHPWDARTIILRGMYIEERPEIMIHNETGVVVHHSTKFYTRVVGDTARVRFNEYHRIMFVPREGVYTLFFTWKYEGSWGFLVNGIKIHYREYLNGRYN